MIKGNIFALYSKPFYNKQQEYICKLEDISLSDKPKNATSTNQDNGNEYQFKKSIFFPWIKFKIRLDRKQLIVTDRKYLLWIIPIGAKKDRVISLQHATEIAGKFRFGINATVASFILILAYVYFISSSFFTDVIAGFVFMFVFSPFLILAVFCFSKGLSCKLFIIDQNKQKQLRKVDISFMEEEKLQEFVDKINQAIKKH